MKYGPLVISVNGYHINSDEETKILQHPLVGGVILFSHNFQNGDQLKELTHEIKNIASDVNKEILIMVDHEGGYVQRFKQGFSAIPSAKSLGEIYDIHPQTALQYANQLGTKVGVELKNAGIDIILGPVVDLDNGNAVISNLDRSYHSDPIIVTNIASAFIEGLEQSGMRATLKHFPGHGADIGDSHLEKPVDNRTWEVLNEQDLLPFKNLIETETIGAIMPAHITYPYIDPNHTVGTSQIWLQDILRGEFQFKGVVISDCLSMAGAGEQSNFDKVLLALEFGDMALLSGQSSQDYQKVLETMETNHVVLTNESQERIQNWLAPVLNSEKNMIDPLLTVSIEI